MIARAAISLPGCCVLTFSALVWCVVLCCPPPLNVCPAAWKTGTITAFYWPPSSCSEACPDATKSCSTCQARYLPRLRQVSQDIPRKVRFQQLFTSLVVQGTICSLQARRRKFSCVEKHHNSRSLYKWWLTRNDLNGKHALWRSSLRTFGLCLLHTTEVEAIQPGRPSKTRSVCAHSPPLTVPPFFR